MIKSKKIKALFSNTSIIFFILLLINLGAILYHLNNKQGFHSDEQWSYAHANSSQGAFLDKDINSYFQINDSIRERLFNQWKNSQILKEYLTVQEAEKFSYKNIYQNLKADVHPPLYFMLLHTVCSFFPNSFSKWYAGSINIIFFILIYVVLFHLSKILLKDDRLAFCTTALYGFSSIGISTVIFLRMYALQTLLSLCLVYEIIKILEANRATSKQLFLIGLYSLLGMYNQYNAIFFSFFATIVSLFFLYKRKNYKLLLQFGITMLLSVIALLAIYPQAYSVLQGSMRAKQVISNLTQQHSANFDIMEILFQLDIRITKFIEIISEQFFSFSNTNYQLIAFLVIIGITLSIYFKTKIDEPAKWIIWVCVLYFIYLQAMPYMHLFHGRYYMSIMPFIAIMTVMFLKNCLLKMHLEKQQIFIIILLLIFLNCINMNFSKSPYRFEWTKAERDTYANIKEKQVFIDSGEKFIWLHSMVYYLMPAKEIFITENICDEKPISAVKQTNNPIIFTYSSYIPGKYVTQKITCLNDLGIEHTTTVCASQHCYDVWEKVNEDKQK